MSAFNSFSTSQRRLTLMWNLVVLLFSVAAIGKARAEDATSSTTNAAPILFFDLPSLSMSLDVEKEGDALIPFQDKLKESMEAHLEKFYTNKILITEVGMPALVDIDLESQLLWQEIRVEPKSITEEAPDHQTYTKTVFVKEYEVKGIYNCKIKVKVTPITTADGEEKPVHVTQSLVNMFFLEAFENDHYWDLMHGFMIDPLLRDIITADINVLDVGFVHPYDENGDLLFETSDNNFMNFNDGAGMSPIMVIASIFIVFFFFALLAIWIYLWIVMKDRNRFYCWKKRKIGRSRSKDEERSSGTGSTGSQDDSEVDSNHGGDDESRGCGWASSLTANLDAWASSVTSIPLREVETKRRKKRGNKVVQRPYFRPGSEHSSSLENITEADNESWCSSVRSGRSSRSNRTSKSRTKRYSRSQSRRADEDSFVIYEGDAENSVDDEEEGSVQGSPLLERQMIKVKEMAKNSPVFVQRQMMKLKEKAQNSPILVQRQLINLVPSEDEFDHSFAQEHKRFGEF